MTKPIGYQVQGGRVVAIRHPSDASGPYRLWHYKRNADKQAREQTHPKRNGTTIIVIGGKRRNPARDSRGRYVKRKR